MQLPPGPSEPSQRDLDRELVERWRRANVDREEAFRAIVERFSPRVAGLFRRKGHPSDRVQELTQETFLRVFNGLGAYRGGAPVRIWILVVANNVHYSKLRQILAQRRRAEAEEMAPAELPADRALEIPADAPSPQEEILQREREAALRKAQAELSPQQRRCLDLWLKGRSIKEIARETGIPTESTVRATLFQAKHRLRKALAGYFSDPGF